LLSYHGNPNAEIKKKIISQLATVTLLSSTLVTTVGVVNPGLVSVKGWADGNEVLDAKITVI